MQRHSRQTEQPSGRGWLTEARAWLWRQAPVQERQQVVGQGQGKQRAMANAWQRQHLEQRLRQQGRPPSRRPVGVGAC